MKKKIHRTEVEAHYNKRIDEAYLASELANTIMKIDTEEFKYFQSLLLKDYWKLIEAIEEAGYEIDNSGVKYAKHGETVQ